MKAKDYKWLNENYQPVFMEDSGNKDDVQWFGDCAVIDIFGSKNCSEHKIPDIRASQFDLFHFGLNIYACITTERAGRDNGATRIVAMPFADIDNDVTARLQLWLNKNDADKGLHSVAEESQTERPKLYFNKYGIYQSLQFRSWDQIHLTMNFMTNAVILSGSFSRAGSDQSQIHLADLDEKGRAYFERMRRMSQHYQAQRHRLSYFQTYTPQP